MKNSIVILSANRFSAYSSSVLFLAMKNNVKVDLIVIKKISGFKRFKNEFKKSGFLLIKKIFQKIVVQKLSSLGINLKNADGFSLYFRDLGPNSSSLTHVSKALNIPILEVDDFHSSNVLERVKMIFPDIILFTGGGLIRQSLIGLSRYGILNCHLGILPKYRGMDCTYWALLLEDYKNIGFTTHLMDVGVDTGPIVKNYFINPNGFSSAKDIIKHLEYLMAPALIESLFMILNENHICDEQLKASGKQFFVMDKKFIEIVEKKINLPSFSMCK